MAAQPLKFYLNDALVNSWQQLTETVVAAATTAGWIVSTGTTNRSKFASGTGATSERAASTFDATTYPNGTIDTTLFDCWRTATAYTGSFASANWTVQGSVRAVTNNGGTETGVLYVRLFRSANTDGSGATEITGAAQASATSGVIATGADTNVTVTFNPGAFSLTNEYLYFQIAWGRVGAGGMTSSDCHFRTGSAAGTGSQVDTAAFTFTETTGETIGLGFDDSSTLLNRFSTADTLAAGLTETSITKLLLGSADTLATALSESTSISYSPRAALTAILTQLMNYGIPGRRYGSFAAKDSGAPTDKTTGESLALNLSEDAQPLFALLTRDESVTAGLTEDRALLALLQREDTLGVSITDLSAIAAALATSDTAVLGLADALDTLTNFMNRDDALVVGLGEDSALFVRLDRDDAHALGLSDSASVLVSFDTADSLAVVISESSQVDQGGVVAINSSDDLTVGLIDAYANLLARIATDDTLPLVWQESAALLAAANRDDTVPVGLSESATLAVNISSNGDTLTVGLSEASAPFVTVAGSDAVQVVLSEASTLFAAISTDDSLAVAMDETVQRILALLQREDSPALVVVEAGTPLIPVEAADALGVHLTESGSAVEIFLNRLGTVLVATVVPLAAERLVRYLRRTVRCLMPLLTVRMP